MSEEQNIQEENNEQNESQFVNPNSETENMEVHHHPQVERKSFKEYILEGLMIFLAVTMGFFAENIRENISDNEKEKELMQSLIKDLEDDSITIRNQIESTKQRLLYSDSLIDAVHSGSVLNNTADFYFYGRITGRWVSFSNNSRSIDEMKNGGWFRVIKNNAVAKSIMSYYAFIPQIKNYEDRQAIVDNEYRKIAVQLFDPYIFNHMLNAGDSIDRVSGNPPLIKIDKETLNNLAGWAHYTISNRLAINEAKERLLTKGKELIALIKKDYHLENE